MALKTKIKCNGIKPSKAEVYTLAAELAEVEDIEGFKVAIIEALKSYDYHNNNPHYYYYYNDYDYYYDDDDYEYYNNDYDYEYYSSQEKVIALLLLAAMYS